MRPLHRVVILGGGFAGVRVARRLASAASRQHLAVTLVNKTGNHAYTPAFYDLAGTPSEATRRHRLELGTALPLRRICAGLPISLIEAEVTAIDTEQKLVTLGDGRSLGYDTLVIALGSEPAFYGIPGLQEHAITLKSIRDAEMVSRRIGTLMRGRAEPVRVIIGGGGPTGVELAAMLAERVGKYQAGAHITLVETHENVLCGFDAAVGRYAQERLVAKGVTVRCGAPVTNVAAHEVTIGDAVVLPFDLLVWTGGIQAPAILATLPYVLDHGRIAVDAPLTCVPVSGETERHVYALGDSVCFHYQGSFAPWTANVALQQAKVVADNILRTLHREKPKPFVLPRQPFIIPLGTRDGIARIAGIPFRGRIVQLLVLLAEGRYLRSVLPWRTTLSLLAKRIRRS